MIKYEQIAKANDSIRATDIKGKDYAEVNQRVKAFRQVHPNGTITTEIVSLQDGVVLMKATILDDDQRLIATGLAYEKENSTFINKTSFIENCETSAVGRALGMCGFGIDVSIASKEEVENAQANQTKGVKKVKEETAKAQSETKQAKMSEETSKVIFNLEETLKSWLVKKFKLESLGELSEEQAQWFIDQMKKKGKMK